MPDGFRVGGALNGSLSGLLQVIDGRLDKTGVQQVMSHQLGLTLDGLRELFLENIGDSLVQLLALASQKAFVGRILYQCVLKSVRRLRPLAALEDKLSSRELGESCLEKGGGRRCNGRNQVIGEFTAEDGTNLGDLLYWRVPVETRHQ